MLGASQSARATTLSWSSTGSSTLGGTGTWDTSTADWWNGTSAIAWTDTAGTTDTAAFGGTAGTVTLGSSLGALGLQFTTAGYTLATGSNTLSLGTGGIDASSLTSGTTTVSGNLSLVGAQSWNTGSGSTLTVSAAVATAGNALTVNGTGTTTLSGIVSGTGSLTQSGTGTLTLSGANTFSGGITIGAGTVAITADNNLGATSSGVSLNGGVLQMTLPNSATTITNTHVITVGASGGTISIVPPTTGSVTPTYNIGSAGNLTGSGALTFTGTGSLGTPGSNNSVLVIGNANTGFTGSLTIQNGAILEVGNATPIATTSAITVNNQGEIALNGVTLSNAITLNGGTLGFNASTAGTYSGTISLSSSGGTIRAQDWWDSTARSGTLSGVISGTGALAINSGTGSGATVTINNNSNSYSGGTTVSSAIVKVGANGALGSGSLTLNGNATLNNSATISGLANNIVLSGTNSIQLGAASNMTLNGTISGSGTLTLGNNNSNSTVFLGGSNSMTSGTITLANNTNAVRFANANAGNANVSWVFSNTTVNKDTLDFGTGTISFGSMTGAGTIQGNAAGTKTISAGALGLNDSFSGVITNGSGTLALTKIGSGTMTLSGANTYTGATTVNAGTLALGAANRLSSSSAMTLNGGTFATGGFNQTLNTLTLSSASTLDFGSGTSALVFADSSAITWSGTLTLTNFDVGTDSLKFGTSSIGLTATQLSDIAISGYTVTGLDSSGFLQVSAIPEPATYAAILGGLVLVGAVISRRRRAQVV
jgi:autotransporter-associated beta strand protein